MGFFSGKSLLRVEYVIWIHDIHRICPLKLDLSHRKKIIGVAFDPTKLEAMEVEFFSHFEAKVEKCFFFEKISQSLIFKALFLLKFEFSFFFYEFFRDQERTSNSIFDTISTFGRLQKSRI